MKKIAIVLSGCGYQDGTEITEAISTFIAIGEVGASYQCFAPNIDFEASNHLNGEKQDQRNALTESARLCRGQVKELDQLNEKEFDALVFPGGFGAALHLSDWAQKGARCQVDPLVTKAIESFHKNSKPIGAICIAPALIAKTLGSHEVTLTIGNDSETAQEIEKTGAIHEECAVDDFITDRAHKVITTPAYMYDDAPPFQVFTGVKNLIKELVEMA